MTLKVLAVSHALGFSSAQVVTLELFKLLRDKVGLYVVISEGSSQSFLKGVEDLGIDYFQVPYKNVWIPRNPYLFINGISISISNIDLIWITDIEYLVAPKLKRLFKAPIVAHLHSYALICPFFSATYRLIGPCWSCSSLKMVRCKQLAINAMANYRLLSFIKGPMDYYLLPVMA